MRRLFCLKGFSLLFNVEIKSDLSPYANIHFIHVFLFIKLVCSLAPFSLSSLIYRNLKTIHMFNFYLFIHSSLVLRNKTERGKFHFK